MREFAHTRSHAQLCDDIVPGSKEPVTTYGVMILGSTSHRRL
jgi:hypothetical protein